MAWEPDRRLNFFFNPPAHLCAVTYMTEISLNVTLNNHIHSLIWSFTAKVKILPHHEYQSFEVKNYTQFLDKNQHEIGKKKWLRMHHFHS